MIAESYGKIECGAAVGKPDRCPAFDFSDKLNENHCTALERWVAALIYQSMEE
jgi:hypothetical protein